MDKLRVGIVGATGMVGQKFISRLHDHPWFTITSLSASSRSAGRTYAEAIEGRWAMEGDVPASVAGLQVYDAEELDKIDPEVDFIFCAISLDKDATRALEDRYALAEIPVVSANSAHRWTPDVPVLIPEVNADHIGVIPAQRQRLGTERGFVTAKPNCSIQPYVPALDALSEFRPKQVSVCTYHAISGAGKTFETWPEMVDNIIPYIGGEEDKSILEPLKIWGTLEGGEIVTAEEPLISAQCVRVPVSDGHMAAVSVLFETKPTTEQILERWAAYSGRPQELQLPSAPSPFLRYFEEDDRPQTGLDRDYGDGIARKLELM